VLFLTYPQEPNLTCDSLESRSRKFALLPTLTLGIRSLYVLSMVETIGEAYALGWHVVARCKYGREDGPSSKSSRECNYRYELDMQTLVWTRGRAFPLSRLESRLRCPKCGSRSVVVMFQPPANAAKAAITR
jgi:hypothetical protein